MEETTPRARPLWAGLTYESSREQVIAAVEESEQRSAEALAEMRKYTDDDIDWRGDPPEKREGCYWSKDGNLRVHMGSVRDEPLSLVRQRSAGEEDQSVPGWDFGA